jgi:uncharacterized protein (DUF1800 family)
MIRALTAIGAAILLALPLAATAAEQPTHGAGEAAALHVLNRLAYGPRPGDVERVERMGIDAYIAEQLHPGGIAMPPALTARLDALTRSEKPLTEQIAAYRALYVDVRNNGNAAVPARRAFERDEVTHADELRLLRAVESPRQLQEVMVDFWFNHFNVALGKGLDHVLVADYERRAIQPHVLGKFRDLLGAVAKHPAMLFYLDNWLSSGPDSDFGYRPNGARRAGGLNENYARELMELHTLGVDGGYSQADVTALARILTGWTFDARAEDSGSMFRFAERRHDYGDKVWLGKNVPAKGEAEGEWALDILAAHPATAHHIAFELAQYFVADDPPPALVARLAKRYLATGGDIRAMLATLFASSEFRDPDNFGAKFKTPYQYVVSAVRAADVPVSNVRPMMVAMRRLGMPLYGCDSPDGYKNTEQTWLNPAALAQRITFATAFGLGRQPLDKPAADSPAPDLANAAMAAAPAPPPPPEDPSLADTPLDATALLATLGGEISNATRKEIAAADPPTLQAALVLGSPDFMRR